MSSFGDLQFWEERWARETEPLEFYQEPDAILSLIKSLSAQFTRVLIPGCGFSKLALTISQQLMTKPSVLACDWSNTAITNQQRRHADSRVEYRVEDSRSLSSISDATIDLIVDKACLDAVFCSESEAETQAIRCLEQYSRVLTGTGYLLVISHSSADLRSQYFAQVKTLELVDTITMGW